VSILYGPCSAAKKVALDPPPEAVDEEKSVALQTMDRDDFLGQLLGEGHAGIRLVSSRTRGSHKGLPQNRVA
jgi:hypothetical protein